MNDIAALLERALGQPPLRKAKKPRLLQEAACWDVGGGVVVRNFVAQNSLNEYVTITVAEPAERLFPHPVIAAHQTNDVGSKEVFGFGGNPELDYGVMLARRGHRVFGIMLRWVDPRANGVFWDFDSFRRANPGWSPLGADRLDFLDLLFLMRTAFGETLAANWMGHSHGGIDGYILAASEPPGTFARVACNAAYLGLPAQAPLEDFVNFEKYLRKEDSIALWPQLDDVIRLACAKTALWLSCYRSDGIIRHPLPDEARAASLRSAENGPELVFYDGTHDFPAPAQRDAALFLERGKGDA